SVVMTHSMVAMPGASMPAPLAMPPMLQPAPPTAAASTTTVLGTVSVVMMATAASWPPASDSAAAAASTPLSSVSMGSRTPMRPVEHTPTSPAETSRPWAWRAAATCSAVLCASWKPAAPVAAFAPPELRTTASRRPSAIAWRLQMTGAATTRLDVNTPAAVNWGPSLTTSATSGLPEALRPAVTPAATNPWGCVTLTMPPLPARRSRPHSFPRRSRRHPRGGESRCLRQPEREVHALQRRARGALDEVVERADRHDPARLGVHRHLDERGVGAHGGVRGGPLALGKHMDERLIGVGRDPRVAHGIGCGARRERRGDRREDAARHGDEDRREGQPHLPGSGRAQVLRDLRDVAVRAAHRVGVGVAERLGGEVRDVELLAGARIPHGKRRDDVVRLHEARRHARLKCQRH